MEFGRYKIPFLSDAFFYEQRVFRQFLKAVNFNTITALFYQLQLTGSTRSYTVNGIYDSAKQALMLTLPSTAQKGSYSLSARLLDATGQLAYNFDTDLQLAFP